MAMNERYDPMKVPPRVLYGIATFIVFAIAFAGIARLTDIGATRLEYASPAESRDLRFEDRNDGAVVIRDANDGSVIDVAEPGTKGFVRIVMRGFAHQRVERGLGPDGSFKLTRWKDGRLSISDPLTQHKVELVGFGTSNVAVFANLLASGRSTP